MHAGGGAASARRPGGRVVQGPVVGAAHSRVEGVARAVGERTRAGRTRDDGTREGGDARATTRVGMDVQNDCTMVRGASCARARLCVGGGRRRRGDVDGAAKVGEGARGATGGVGEEDGVGGFVGEGEGVFSRRSRAFGGDSNAFAESFVRGGVVDRARAVQRSRPGRVEDVVVETEARRAVRLDDDGRCRLVNVRRSSERDSRRAHASVDDAEDEGREDDERASSEHARLARIARFSRINRIYHRRLDTNICRIARRARDSLVRRLCFSNDVSQYS